MVSENFKIENEIVFEIMIEREFRSLLRPKNVKTKVPKKEPEPSQEYRLVGSRGEEKVSR